MRTQLDDQHRFPCCVGNRSLFKRRTEGCRERSRRTPWARSSCLGLWFMGIS